MRIIKIIISTLLLLILFTIIYSIVYIIPNILINKELTKAVNIIYPKYLYLSQVRSYQMGYLSLKSESMQFAVDKNTYLSKIDESIEKLKSEIKKPYRKGFLLFPKKELSINLNYIQKADRDLSIRLKDIIVKQSLELEKIKKINSVLGNFYGYDMVVDFGGFDINSSSDRDIILQRVQSASKGLSKVSDNLVSLGDKYREFSKDITKLSEDFSQMDKYVQSGDFTSYDNLFNKTVDKYEDLRNKAFLLEIDIYKESSYLEILSNEKDIIQKYEGILQKIDEIRGKE